MLFGIFRRLVGDDSVVIESASSQRRNKAFRREQRGWAYNRAAAEELAQLQEEWAQSKGGRANTISALSAPRLQEPMTIEEGSNAGSHVLDASGAPIKIEFTLWPIPYRKALPYSAGDRIPFELRMSRDWTMHIELPVVAAPYSQLAAG